MKDARGTTKKLLENSSKITPSLAKPGPARPETIEFYYHFWPFETCVPRPGRRRVAEAGAAVPPGRRRPPGAPSTSHQREPGAVRRCLACS